MKWAKVPTIVGKWIVIKYFVCGQTGSKYGVFKVKNYRDFPATYKVVISPSKPFKELFVDYDIYSMDLASMVNDENVFDSYQAAKKYYDSVVE